MSDTMQGPVEDAVAGPPPGAGSDRRRPLVLLLVVAGLLVVGAAAYLLFLSGGDEEVAGPVVPAPAPAEPGKADKQKDKAGNEVPKEVEADFAVGRDPFQPLAAEAVKKDPVAPADSGSTDTGTDPGTPAPAPSAPVTPVPPPAPAPVTTYEVKLVSVNLAKEKATIEVDGKRYVLEVKDMFPNTKTGPFQLTTVGERPSGKDTATVVFGADAPVELVQQDTVTFQN